MSPISPIPLPIDSLIPEITSALAKHNAAVVTAEPGAGKTTRVPPALLSAPFAAGKPFDSAQGREIWVLQPRRLAAKMAALRVAGELGEEIGRRVGYQFRFEKVAGPETRLKFMTDGMLLPLSQEDPRLSRVAAVILDEFHERSLELDLGLGFLRRLQLGPRPDLRIVIMSATLDAGELSTYLSTCPVFKSEGRTFPVNVEYHPFPQEPDLSLKVKSALRHLTAKGIQGTTLVFLPGLGEIRRCQQALGKEAGEIHALYGDLPVSEQQAVLKPSAGNKVILSTNVAETSLTVPGVTAVVDSGLTRQSRVSAWSGLGSLVTVPASQASAVQRAGRAGRLQEGFCFRLYTKFDFDHRSAFDLPEIQRADLSRSLLDLLSLGVEDLGAFPWFLKPSPASLEASQALLGRLGAVKEGKLTSLGRNMAGLPVAPRLAKFLLEAKELASGNNAVLKQACRLAALISEERPDGEDLLEELGKYRPDFEAQKLEDKLFGLMGKKHAPSPSTGEGRGEGAKRSNFTPHPNPSPERLSQGKSPVYPQNHNQGEREKHHTLLAKALLSAFPDRVAKVRPGESTGSRNLGGRKKELLLSGGGSAVASDSPLTRAHEYFVVVEAQETTQGMKGRMGGGAQSQAKARSLCPIETDWLLDLFPDHLTEQQTCEWNEKSKRVEGFKRLKYDELVLDEKPLSARDFGPETRDLLFKEALAAGPAAYCDPEELESFLNRVKFVAQRAKEFPKISETEVEETLKGLCEGYRSLEDLRAAGLVPALRSRLSPKDQALLEKLAPGQVALPSGRRMTIHYEEGKPPWGESRIQDFFGMKQGPAVAGGEVPVVLHLLSPAQRPVQVTSDLSGFWKNHYPQTRKELSRRYPRHKWPENPV